MLLFIGGKLGTGEINCGVKISTKPYLFTFSSGKQSTYYRVYGISSNPVRQSEYFSSLTSIYHRTNLIPAWQFKYFLSPIPIYQKINSRFFKPKYNDFSKSNCKISQLYVRLMNRSDKKFVFASYNTFLKIELKLIVIEKIMLILNGRNFQKKMLFNLTCVLIYSLTKCALEDGLKDSVVTEN